MNLTDRAGSDRSVNYRERHVSRCPTHDARARRRRAEAGRARAVRDRRIRRDVAAAHRRPRRLLQVERALPLRVQGGAARGRDRARDRRVRGRARRTSSRAAGAGGVDGSSTGSSTCSSSTARPCTCSSSRARASPHLPIIGRANAAVRRLTEAISEQSESMTDQVRFGIALGGAAFLLTAARSYVGDDQRPTDDEFRVALHEVLGESFGPADRRLDPDHRLRDIRGPPPPPNRTIRVPTGMARHRRVGGRPRRPPRRRHRPRRPAPGVLRHPRHRVAGGDRPARRGVPADGGRGGEGRRRGA